MELGYSALKDQQLKQFTAESATYKSYFKLATCLGRLAHDLQLLLA